MNYAMLAMRARPYVTAAVPPPPTEGWNISTAVFVQSFSVSPQGTQPFGITFKPDGTRMYVIENAETEVNEYSLSSAWDISTASYVRNFSVSGQENTPRAIAFRADGTGMYIVGVTGDDVNEYSLSSAWDISTASYVRNFSVSSRHTQPTGVAFKNDGTKMFIVGHDADAVSEYSLSTAWDISTASYTKGLDVSSKDGTPCDLSFSPDGTRMYFVGATGDAVHQYSLSSAWDISTASYVGSFNVISQDASPFGLAFRTNGTRMYISGNSGDSIYEYALTS